VEVKSGGIHGHCWFAKSDIKAGEMVWKMRAKDAKHTDVWVNKKTIQSWSSAVQSKFLSLAYQVDDDLWCGFDPNVEPIHEELIEDYVNHSCGGNCWYESYDLLTAMRDISAGEEVCYDYVLTESDPEFVLADKCNCGTKLCRGKVTGNDWKLADLQSKYRGHFLPHVQKLITAASSTSSTSSSSSSSSAASSSAASSSSSAQSEGKSEEKGDDEKKKKEEEARLKEEQFKKDGRKLLIEKKDIIKVDADKLSSDFLDFL